MKAITRHALLVLGASLLVFAPSALAAPPVHPSLADPIGGFALDHACGTAVDPRGDIYVANAGESKIEVFDPSGNHLTSIADTHEPCGLAVDSKGTLYVSNQASGEVAVVKYTPDAYPPTASPTYTGPATVDASPNARGIAVDPTDDRLYVAEGTRVSAYQPDGTTGQDEVQRAIVDASVTGGEYTLTFESQTTAPIPYNAAPGQVQAALEALSTIGAGNVSVEEGSNGNRSYDVTFTHALGSEDVPSLSANSAGLSGGSVEAFTLTEGFAFSGHIGEGELTDATAVAAFTYEPQGEAPAHHYLFAADSGGDVVKVLSGPRVDELEAGGTIDGKAVPDSPECPKCSEGFGFGPSGAALAADWASGHLFVYDSGHSVVDEFEASGRYLDQVHSAELSDAEPSGLATLPERSAVQEVTIGGSGGTFQLEYEGEATAPLPKNASAAQIQTGLEGLAAIGTHNVTVRSRNEWYVIAFTGALANRAVGNIVVDVSGVGGLEPFASTSRLPGYGPGRLYVSAGSGPGAKLLAFGPLAPAGRGPLSQEPPEPPSQVLPNAAAVTTDSHGDVYAAAGKEIRIYDPSGHEVTKFIDGESPYGLALDSRGNVYVLDEGPNISTEAVTYYTPSSYPPTSSTSYTRHEPPILKRADVAGAGNLVAIAIDPANDHVFATARTRTVELGSAEEGSPILKPEFGSGISLPPITGIGVCAANNEVYFADNAISGQITIVNAAGTEVLARITGAGSPRGLLPRQPKIAVDQSDCDVLAFDPEGGSVREFDADGAFVAEFGQIGGGGPYAIAIDSACAIHRNGADELKPLDETTTPPCAEYDPADGDAYVAHDEAAPNTPDLWAFGPLSYGGPPIAVTGSASGLGGGKATLHGTVDPRGFELEECSFEYLTDAEYRENLEESHPPFEGATAKACAETPPQIGHDPVAVPVHADAESLDPEGRYRFRLVAKNEFGQSEGKAGLFGPPVLEIEPAAPLYDEAILHARIEPAGLLTDYHFEYGPPGGPAGEYGHSTPLGELAPGEAFVAAQARIGNLAEGAIYHFRIVAENEAKTVPGPDQKLSTLVRRGEEHCANSQYRTGLSANLPDCRAYELVTPAESGGLSPSAGEGSPPFDNWLTVPRGADAGGRLSYFTQGTLSGFEGSGLFDGYRADRGAGEHPAGGWTNRLVGPDYTQDHAIRAFTNGIAPDQLYAGWRIGAGTANFEDSLPVGSSLHTPGLAGGSPCNLQPLQVDFELLACGSLGIDAEAQLDHLSSGGAHVTFSSSAHLEPGAPPRGPRRSTTVPRAPPARK